MKKNIALTLFLITAFSLFARDITITVKDIDLDLPLEGAIIHTGDGNRIACDKDGKAVITIPDRQIVIQAAYPGYETGRIVIPSEGDSFTISLRLSGIMQSRELIIERSRPGTNDSRTGRSVSVGEKEIAQTAEIGIIEDVMSTIKLLPGVSYSGFFNAQPSIRGGHPGDMVAAFDGFYVNNPYHWGGGFSIFDPRMVQSAQLSHGVFSARYGHTISGLLEITSKNPSPVETQFELGINTSAANMNLSLPIANRGGILFMGRITYYDPIIALMKGLSNFVTELDVINYIRTAPYIRSTAISGNYRFTDKLELAATGFFGVDGVGVKYDNISNQNGLLSDTTAKFNFTNFQGFLTSSLSYNPRSNMLLKLTLGTGYENMIVDGVMNYNINKKFSNSFPYPPILILLGSDGYSYEGNMHIDQSDFLYNLQGRIDYDWQLSDQLIFSLGVQEMFNRNSSYGVQETVQESFFYELGEYEQTKIKTLFPSNFSSYFAGPEQEQAFWNSLRVEMPLRYNPNAENKLFTTSGYFLGELSTKNGRIKTEAGLRIDHFYLIGKNFNASSDPAFNPRINMDFNILKDVSFIESMDISVGTGLFSSMNSMAFYAEERFNTTYLKPNRSWTSIMGVKFKFPESLSLNIEGYYKYIYDRMYIKIENNIGEQVTVTPYFNGEGIVWGIDTMLHKVHGRFWDGWLTYSYSWAKYRDPNGTIGGRGISGGVSGNDWYFPDFHRFHTLNLIFNYKPVQNMNIYVRFGLASGSPIGSRVGNAPYSYPLLTYDENELKFIEKFRWPSVQDESNRTTISLPMDIKYSIFGSNNTGKVRYEVYVAIENVLALLYTAKGNISYNQYTGEVDRGSNSANYEIPVPIPSFGFKIMY